MKLVGILVGVILGVSLGPVVAGGVGDVVSIAAELDGGDQAQVGQPLEPVVAGEVPEVELSVRAARRQNVALAGMVAAIVDGPDLAGAFRELRLLLAVALP